MNEPLLLDANQVTERELDQLLTRIAELFDADALSMSGPIIEGIDDLVRNSVEVLKRRSGLDRLPGWSRSASTTICWRTI